jgi:hypothetical protein
MKSEVSLTRRDAIGLLVLLAILALIVHPLFKDRRDDWMIVTPSESKMYIPSSSFPAHMPAPPPAE